MNSADANRMQVQCRRTLEITSDSFVFIYSQDDVYVIPASAVFASIKKVGTQKYYCKNFKSFMADYLKSFIADVTITCISNDDFEDNRNKYQARNVLLFEITH